MKEQWVAHFFKPDIRAAGEALVAKGAVFLKIGSDTQIEATVKATLSIRVVFRAASIADEEFSVDCTCGASQRGQFCKHIWATLVFSLEKKPDFFSSKTKIEKLNRFADETAAKAKAPKSELQLASAAAAEKRKREYKEKQKARAKELKATRAGSDSKQNRFLPDAVQSALKYFETNGFSFTVPIDVEALDNAKRVLSRVFHPDKGGTQAEIIELLHHADVLKSHR